MAVKYRHSVKLWISKLILITFTFVSLSACERLSEDNTSKNEDSKINTFYKKPKGSNHQVLWERLRKNFNIKPKLRHAQEQQRIQQFVDHYHGNDKHLNRMSTKASPYLHYIVEELEKRNMPGELALLPMIESAFEPQATSRKGAAGLWQFMGGTGRQFGLKQDKWYDGRRDITASTKAALDYLQFLHDEFDNNWMLALAAYNAGPGTVRKAIKRNQREGLPVHFWALKLPKETQMYVPKFLALVEVIKNPGKHDISLPIIENKPYFVPVSSDKHLTFNKVAQLAEMNIQEVKKLNPGYRQASTHPKGPKQLLLPAANAEKLIDGLSKLPPETITKAVKLVNSKSKSIKSINKTNNVKIAAKKTAARKKVSKGKVKSKKG